MASNSKLSARGTRGFTLVELLIGASLSSIIMLGVITSFLFLGRSMIRISNNGELQGKAAIASATVQKDIANAEAITAISSVGITLTVDLGSGPESITYAYSDEEDEITRASDANTYTLLRNVTACAFSLTDSNSNATTVPASVKKIEFDATTAMGLENSGTYVVHQLVSPAMIVAGNGF